MVANLNVPSSFMDHPFWTEILSIPQEGQNSWIINQKTYPPKEQSKFLQLIVEGFYPISYASLLSFRRVAELSPHSETQELAREIYEIESGKHPIINDSPHKDLYHCDQLKLMVQSLLKDIELNVAEPQTFAIHDKLRINEAKLVSALAFCECIELTAPAVISYYQDFVAQWQCVMNIPSSHVDRIYLDEHGLTEGNDSEDQHIQMVNRMLMPHNDLIMSQEYKDAKRQFHYSCSEHLNEVLEKIQVLSH